MKDLLKFATPAAAIALLGDHLTVALERITTLEEQIGGSRRGAL